jgi:plasmid maintenance system antidote protein VapI
LAEYGEQLEGVRKQMEVCNITALAKKIKLSRPTLYEVMNGNTENIRLSTFVKLVKYFKIS